MRGAYFVIVTISFAEVVRLVALNWVELTQGPLALNNIPSITVGLPGLGDLTLRTKLQNYYLVLSVAVVAYVLISRLVHSHFGRAMRRADGKRDAGGLGRHRRDADLMLAAVISAGDRRRGRQPLRALHPDHRSRRVRLHQYRDDGDHGHHRRQGHAGRPVVGGMIFGLLPVFLRPIMAPEAQWIAYGGVLIVILFVLPRGIVPSLAQRFAKRRSRTKRLPRSRSPNATPRSTRDGSRRPP